MATELLQKHHHSPTFSRGTLLVMVLCIVVGYIAGSINLSLNYHNDDNISHLQKTKKITTTYRYGKSNFNATTQIETMAEDDEEDDNKQWLLKARIKELENELKNMTHQKGYIHNNITYGHLHMAKTGGTTLNGLLALNYERVCGRKGYSYDYYQANIRFNGTKKGQWNYVKDTFNTLSEKHNWNRGRVQQYIMDEIGYEDCDWISTEKSAEVWERFRNWHQPIELHVPCREPIDHLMSQCNYKHRVFDCGADNLDLEITRCLVFPNRFNIGLENGTILPKDSLKCYDYKVQFTKYMKLMEGTLQRKKITSKYIQRDTNQMRNKSRECIWENEFDYVREYVTARLTKSVHYYNFCNRCIGSDIDLFA